MTKLIEKLKEIGFTSNEIETVTDKITYDNEVKINNVTVSYIDGYRGSEGEGENINFLIKVVSSDNDFEEFYANLRGEFDSWEGKTIDWDDITVTTFLKRETQLMERNVFSCGYTTEWVKV
jgi:hypothetical protein